MNSGVRHSIGVAVAFATLMSIALNEASAKGGFFTLHSAWSPVSRAEAGTITHPHAEVTAPAPIETFGGCGGKRYRDPNTHRCRGPGDF